MSPTNTLSAALDAAIAAIEPALLEWRRDLHEHPELGNREFRTAGIVAAHLRGLGLEVRTGVAHTGVVGVLTGALPGPVVALRADMDGLPVQERVDLPFASRVKTQWNGEEVGVMHACGHDAHVSILMAVASVLTGLRGRLTGSVKFIFQPAEELPPEGEDGGAKLMIEQGALQNPVPDVIFGLHVTSRLATGQIGYRAGPAMASADRFRINILGRQTHGAMPWFGVDPIVTAAQVVLGLQTIVSRQVDLTQEPAVVTIGAIKGGTVPREYIPAVDKGLRDAITSGVLAGYPVVDVKFTLFDGSYHDVDSNENAFRMAASMAFKEGMKKASPTLLEPMMAVEVETPEDYMGNVMGDLSSRRGMVQGMEDQVGGIKLVKAEVPLAEMFGYATTLRSLSQGRATYSMEFKHYTEAPKNVAEAVINKK